MFSDHTGKQAFNQQEKLTPYLSKTRFNKHVDEVMSTLFFYKTTKTSLLPRVSFNPAKKTHRQAYAEFVKVGKWPMNFFIEEPHLSVPHTVMNKLALYAIRRELV